MIRSPFEVPVRVRSRTQKPLSVQSKLLRSGAYKRRKVSGPLVYSSVRIISTSLNAIGVTCPLSQIAKRPWSSVSDGSPTSKYLPVPNVTYRPPSGCCVTRGG